MEESLSINPISSFHYSKQRSLCIHFWKRRSMLRDKGGAIAICKRAANMINYYQKNDAKGFKMSYQRGLARKELHTIQYAGT